MSSVDVLMQQMQTPAFVARAPRWLTNGRKWQTSSKDDELLLAGSRPLILSSAAIHKNGMRRALLYTEKQEREALTVAAPNDCWFFFFFFCTPLRFVPEKYKPSLDPHFCIMWPHAPHAPHSSREVFVYDAAPQYFHPRFFFRPVNHRVLILKSRKIQKVQQVSHLSFYWW